MTNLDRILKSRDTIFCCQWSKGVVFPVVICECESLTRKTAEHQKLVLLNCGTGEDSQVSFGLEGEQTSQS